MKLRRTCQYYNERIGVKYWKNEGIFLKKFLSVFQTYRYAILTEILWGTYNFALSLIQRWPGYM